jgi:molybdenum cofactor cytidylyltransferase
MKNLAVLVLAAGKSSRMKSIKQLEKINNKTLIEITLETAKKVTPKNIFCVLGANAKKIQKEISIKDVQIIYNKNFESGLSSSIVAGVHHFKNEKLKFDGILILLADQPAITVFYLQSLIDKFNLNPTKIVASVYHHNYGVPVIIPQCYFTDLLDLKGDRGAKHFLMNHKECIIISKTNANLVDLDSKEDLDFYKNQIK